MSANLWRNLFIFLFVPGLFLNSTASVWGAEGKTQAEPKKTSTQQIGGLLFDVDEGVKIEKGPGGSVYVKSNKEYMQDKFLAIDNKIKALEERIQKLEEAQDPKAKTGISGKSEERKAGVLVT